MPFSPGDLIVICAYNPVIYGFCDGLEHFDKKPAWAPVEQFSSSLDESVCKLRSFLSVCYVKVFQVHYVVHGSQVREDVPSISILVAAVFTGFFHKVLGSACFLISVIPLCWNKLIFFS